MFLGAFEMRLQIVGCLFELSRFDQVENDQMFLALPLPATIAS